MPGDSTFEQLTDILALYAPGTSYPLLRQFVNNSYSRALVAYPWTELKRAGVIRLPAPTTAGTVSLTNGSVTVTGSGTSWTSALNEKQLVVGGAAPFWDIQTVASPTSLVLTTAYAGPDVVGGSYSIGDIYIIPPSDFQNYTSFVDMGTQYWELDRRMTQEVIDRYDPRRQYAAARPVNLVSTTPSPFSSSSGRPRYELYPRPSGAQTYQFHYSKQLPLLSAPTDTIIYPLRGDIIREGAFMYLAMWPGTEEAPNPYHAGDFIARANAHDKLFQEGLSLAKIEDREIESANIAYREDWKRVFPFPGVVGDASFVTVP